MTQSIVVVSGGLGVPSTSRMLGDQIGEAARAALAERGIGAGVGTIELRDFAVDITNNMLTRYASPRLAEMIDTVTGADGLVIVSPVFTASVSGLLKSFLDVLDPQALEGMPVVMAATGGSARHSMVLEFVMRPIFSYLRAAIMPTGVFAAPEDWGSDTGGGHLAERAARAGAELAAAIEGAAPTRRREEPMTSLPFEQLLANIRPGA
ncbi:CE1759 family FMN reductase [Paeniglutamicibacter cryotolerans]|uniref:FMN reductase n=1 Tax=Paeniglutamicibacter cryotolerans TaxID=670079 RepID=A0A839QM19_9MICC|nr:CE1759 family FMN reductase [Paeniglutamicibacter cryotolerans]MBB2995804.1 FMN reductase [Paeniglutamicibacter cryotolerans]